MSRRSGRVPLTEEMALQRLANNNAISAAIRDIVLVDAHAHNLVELNSPLSLLHAFSEAGPEALENVRHTIPFKRGVRDIAELYGVAPTLESVEAHRRSLGLDNACAKCFAGAKVGTLLVDEGLRLEGSKDLSWLRKFVPIVRRILRIEVLAEDILNTDDKCRSFEALEEKFLSSINSSLSDIVALKSIAAYRSGLAVDPAVTAQEAEEGLQRDLKLARGRNSNSIRLQNKAVIDRLFVRALELATSHEIPMQIHTGFGDRDEDLQLSNPLLLRAVLEDDRFSASRLVLLHASYPYMREASYLSSVYNQVFLDIGLAIPKLSALGMKAAVSQLLELTPLNKLMYSSDGAGFPETFYLGAKWARFILGLVLCEAVEYGDLLVDEAIAAAADILRNNSVAFYHLDETQVTYSEATVKFRRVLMDEPKETNPLTLKEYDFVRANGEQGLSETAWLDKSKYVRLMWSDGSGQRRCRVVPSARYKKSVAKSGVGLCTAAMGMTSQVDGPAPGTGLNAAGEIRIIPDPSTGVYVPRWGDSLVLVDMCHGPGADWEFCPRSTLRRQLKTLYDEFGLTIRVGFEIEFYLLRRSYDKDGYEGIDFSAYCTTNGLNQSGEVVSSILSMLETFGVTIEQFHPEAGGGQFEVALAHDTGLRIADKLLLAREAITAAALSHGLIATFLPKLFLKNTAFGTGSHCHISLWKDGKNVLKGESESKYGLSAIGQNFMAGVLKHLPAVLAFVAPHPNSYDRIQPNTWSGAFHCWGVENREAPIRAVLDTSGPGLVDNFELKSFDGCANPHLGLAAIVAAGLSGLKNKLELPLPVEANPADLKEGEVKRLPASLAEATKELEEDTTLQEIIGKKLTSLIVAIRKYETELYPGSRSKEEILRELIHKY